MSLSCHNYAHLSFNHWPWNIEIKQNHCVLFIDAYWTLNVFKKRSNMYLHQSKWKVSSIFVYLYSVILAIIPIDLILPCPTFQLKHLVDLHKNSWFTFNTYMTHPLHLFCTAPRNTGVHDQYGVLLYLSSILVIVMLFFSLDTLIALCDIRSCCMLHVSPFDKRLLLWAGCNQLQILIASNRKGVLLPWYTCMASDDFISSYWAWCLKYCAFDGVTAHWPVGWTILVSGHKNLVQWLSMCYHVSYEPGSISLLRSKAVSMTTSWQSVWQPYRHTNVKGSQPDNFIVVSLTTLQAIKWCQAFCCDGCGAVHKTNTQGKVNGLYCDKALCRSGLLSHQEQIQASIYKLNHNYLYKFTHAPMCALLYFVIHSLIHSLIHSHLLSLPLLATLSSAPWPLEGVGGWGWGWGYHLWSGVLLLLLVTLSSATWQHLTVLPRSVSEHQLLLTFRHASLHPCHSESTPAILGEFATMQSLQVCTHMSPLTIYSLCMLMSAIVVDCGAKGGWGWEGGGGGVRWYESVYRASFACNTYSVWSNKLSLFQAPKSFSIFTKEQEMIQ